MKSTNIIKLDSEIKIIINKKKTEQDIEGFP